LRARYGASTWHCIAPERSGAALDDVRVVAADEEADRFLHAVVCPRRRDAPRLAAAFEQVEMHHVPTAHGRVAAWRLGDGPAALLLHGWEDDHTLWAPLIDALIERGRALVACDFPGHGFSEGEISYGAEWADSCLALAAALGPIDAIVGHSAGCGPSMMATTEGLVVERAALVAPPMRGGNRWQRVAQRMGVSAEVAAEAQARYETRIGAARAAFHLGDLLPTVDFDVLLVHSTDDERMPVATTEAAAARCPRAELLVISGADHRRTARDPKVVRRIVDFLSS
jgi:pimeloyl-ACP methyl ester carboxylesterase